MWPSGVLITVVVHMVRCRYLNLNTTVYSIRSKEYCSILPIIHSPCREMDMESPIVLEMMNQCTYIKKVKFRFTSTSDTFGVCSVH